MHPIHPPPWHLSSHCQMQASVDWAMPLGSSQTPKQTNSETNRTQVSLPVSSSRSITLYVKAQYTCSPLNKIRSMTFYQQFPLSEQNAHPLSSSRKKSYLSFVTSSYFSCSVQYVKGRTAKWERVRVLETWALSSITVTLSDLFNFPKFLLPYV